MTIKHKPATPPAEIRKREPATPLPWVSGGAELVHANPPTDRGTPGGAMRVAYFRLPEDKAYAIHTANAYPRLVDALLTELAEREAAEADADNNVREAYERERVGKIRDVLRELGELE